MATLGSQVDSEYILVDTFTGDGSTVVFGPLSIEVPSPGQIGVHNNGYYQIPSTNYSISANLTERLITFNTAPQLGNTIVVLHLGRGATQFADILDDAVGTTALVDGSVTGPKIALSTINAGKSIVAGSITGNLINDQTITGNAFATNTITGNLINDQTITGDSFATNTITGNLIATTAISGNQIASDSLTGSLLRANTISGNMIGQGAISANNLNSPARTKAANNALGLAKIIKIQTAGDYAIDIPSQTARLRITGVGGGGGGGALVTGSGTTYGGNGGGAAGFIAYINGPFVSNTFNVTVGAGGLAGVANYNANTVTPGGIGGTTRIWNVVTSSANISVSANGGYGSNAYNTFAYGRPSAPYGLFSRGAKGGVAGVANTTNPSFVILTFAGYDSNTAGPGASGSPTYTTINPNAGASILGFYGIVNLPQSGGVYGGMGHGAAGVYNINDLGYHHDPAYGNQDGWSNGSNGYDGGIIIEY